MRIDESIVKIENHNASFNPETATLALGPTYKVYHSSEWHTGVSLHKWTTAEGARKGNYIAIAIVKPVEDEKTTECIPVLEMISKSFTEDNSMFENIENGKLPEDIEIVVYKFSVNVWRPVLSTKTKWTFDLSCHKPTKDEPCLIQRILKN